MKKKIWNSKRMIALLLAVALVFGQSNFALAGAVSENAVNETVSVSGNTAEDIAPEKAYDGTPSKVIGLEGTYTPGDGFVLRWNSLNTENKIAASDGRVILIGYEIEENGKILELDVQSTDKSHWIFGGTNYWGGEKFGVGQGATYRVRGIYYTEDTKVDPWQVNVIAVGEWSDAYTYTRPADKTVGTVTGITFSAYENDENDPYVKVTWNPLPEASYYSYQLLRSDVPLTGLTDATWDEFWKRRGASYEAFRDANPDSSIAKNSGTVYGAALSIYHESDYRYYYIRAYAYANEGGYINPETYSSMASFDAVRFAKTAVKPVENFKVECEEGDTYFELTWTPFHTGKMAVYAYEAKTFPQYYYYAILNARGTAQGESWQTYFRDVMDSVTRTTINRKVYSVTNVNPSDGRIGSHYFDLEPGKTYYFVAHAYDSTYAYEDRTPVVTKDGIAFTQYNDVSAASAVVSAKVKVAKPSVRAASDKTKITLTMQGSDGSTGYEIYKKSGKKYKKIATTTDNVYVDQELKTGTKYQYKVRAYYYNKNTKKKSYSEYAYITGETTTVKSIDLVVKHKSKTSVSLKWNKVSGATKYEIYRTSSDSGNPYEEAKENSANKDMAYLMNDAKYELVKTITKASTTSYTDKGLAQGEYYQYRIVAYYKIGKKTEYVAASDGVNMNLETPWMRTSLSKTTAKFSWDKNKYASKYEVRYVVYDKYGKQIGDWKTNTTTKSSISIKNVPDGGYAEAKIRAVSKSKRYSAWSGVYSVYNGLAVAKSIKAKNVTQKNAAGETVNAVKITWKKVSGAKYYKVYRGTKQNTYNKDTKEYLVEERFLKLIAAQSNDDEWYNEVAYKQYYEEEGSIVGTTAYDYAQLDEGVNYYYYVVAFGEKGTRVYSTYGSENYYGSSKPACVSYKGTLTINSIKNSKKGQVTIKWNRISGKKKYYVYRSTKKNSGYKLLGYTPTTSYTDKKATKGKTYYYKIVAEGTNDLKADFEVTSSAKKIKVKK